MKLISTLLSIFGIVIVVGLPASLVSAIVLNTLMGGRGLVLPPFLYLIAVIGSFLAMSVTMVGRCPLWQVAGVAVISMCVMYLGREVHLTKELTAFGWIVFCISAIPFLTLRLCGLRFVVAVHGFRVSVCKKVVLVELAVIGYHGGYGKAVHGS